MLRKRRSRNGKQASEAYRDRDKGSQVEVLVGLGLSRLDAIKKIGVVERAYYRCRVIYTGNDGNRFIANAETT